MSVGYYLPKKKNGKLKLRWVYKNGIVLSTSHCFPIEPDTNLCFASSMPDFLSTASVQLARSFLFCCCCCFCCVFYLQSISSGMDLSSPLMKNTWFLCPSVIEQLRTLPSGPDEILVLVANSEAYTPPTQSEGETRGLTHS